MLKTINKNFAIDFYIKFDPVVISSTQNSDTDRRKKTIKKIFLIPTQQNNVQETPSVKLTKS